MCCDVKMLKFITYLLLLSTSKIQFSFGDDLCVQCDCKANAVDCSGKEIANVPDLRNGNKSIILFNNNKILHLYRFPKLKVHYLSFAHNYITTIDDSAFKNLYNLTTLDLSYNLLSSVSLLPNIFKVSFFLS